MKKMTAPVLFSCPQCKKEFEFDYVGEHEFVPCPICGTEFVTTKKGNKLKLENFGQAPTC